MAYYQQQPFYNPQIPFTGSIQGGLQDGKSITVSGRVLPGADRFHVNLQGGSSASADIALHINPRYDSGPEYTVLNTNQNSYWGTEECLYQSLFPMGSPFNLLILVTSHSYQISVNGIHIMDYKHRIPFSRVNTIVVDGMVEINAIGFQDAVVPSCAASTTYSVPYKTTINGGMWPGKNISIQGVVNSHASRFEINLLHKNGIAFHYNPRFDENLVVRNTKTMAHWGPEERSGDMPFHKGQNFQVIISCNPCHYNVFVNGKQAHTYNHRFPNLWEIDALEVSGDLSLTDVNV